MSDPDALRERLRALPPEKRALVERMLLARRLGNGGVPPRDRSVPARLAPPQRRLWFMDQLAPGSPVYNAVVAIRVQGPLDLVVLRTALERVVARHELLHSVIHAGPDPSQVVLDEWEVTFELRDVSDETPPGPSGDAARLSAAIDLLREFCRRPYDLARDLPLRVAAVALGPDDHLIGFAEHHIAFDGWSDDVLFTELSDAYRALVTGEGWHPDPLRVQYADVAEWLHARPADGPTEDYWRAALAGAPAAVQLPTDRPHPPVPRYVGVHVPLRIPGVLEELSQLRTDASATSFMVLIAALAGAVFRWSGASDLVVGSPFANRTHPDLEPLIGFFSNTLPLRLRIDADETFRQLIARSRATCIDAFQHQELAFERIVELSRQPRDRRRNPLFQVNLRVQQGGPPVPDLPGTTTSPVDVDLGFARFDLAADLLVTDEQIEGYVEYNSDLFDRSTIDDFVTWMSAFVQDCLRRPDVALRDLRFGPEAAPVRGRRRAAGAAR